MRRCGSESCKFLRRGAVFWLMEPQVAGQRKRVSKAPTVMVVDDDLGCREVLTEFLRIWGYDVEVAANGKEALEKLHTVGQPPPSVILLDLMMPVMGGREFRQEQLRDPLLAKIPVVIVSAAREALESERGVLRASEHLK